MLLVENDLQIRQALGLALTDDGCEVIEAPDGESAQNLGSGTPVDILGGRPAQCGRPRRTGESGRVSLWVQVVGVVAVLVAALGGLPVLLGMLVLPILRRTSGSVVRVLLALTVGLLAYLAVDALLEGIDLAVLSGGAFGGPILVLLGAGLAFLALTTIDKVLAGRRPDEQGTATGMRLAVMIAIGIGLHNLGEGLVIGSAYAVGELALGAALIVGFAAHNTTEGLAIVAPLTTRRPSLLSLVGLGLIAGTPAILGAVIGASVDNAGLSALLFGVGVGAIVQVIIQIVPGLRDRASGRLLDPAVLGGSAPA